MARRRSNTSVSLFPFLAVLVCTMGALILLLLVTTRRIRQKQAVVEVTAPVVVPERTDFAARQAVALSRQILKASQSLARLKQQHAEQKQQLREADDAGEKARLEAADLEAAAATLRDALDSDETEQQTADDELQAAEQKLARLRLRSQQLAQDLAAVTAAKGICEARLIALKNRAAETERLTGEYRSALVSLRRVVIDRQQQESHSGAPKTVIDFTNSSGTVRSPIVVEVDGAGYRLAATDILIRHEDLKGFPSTNNPLLSALLAVNAARSGNTIASEPYVLLLVRPSGILGFYPAQRCLQESELHFGYDLVSDQQEFAKVVPAEGEAEAVRAAVLASLMRRERYLAAAEDLQDRLSAIVAAQRPRPQDVFRDRARPGETLDDRSGNLDAGRPAEPLPERRPLVRRSLDASGRAFIPEGRFDTDPDGSLPQPLNLHPAEQFPAARIDPGAPSRSGKAGSTTSNATDRSEHPGDEFDAMLASGGLDSANPRDGQSTGVTASDDLARLNVFAPSDSYTDRSSDSPTIANQSTPQNGVLSDGQSLDEFWDHMQPLDAQPSGRNSSTVPHMSAPRSQATGQPAQNAYGQTTPSITGTTSGGGTSANVGSSTPLPPELAAALAAAASAGASTTRQPVTILLDAEQIVVGSRPAMKLRGRSLNDALAEVLQGLSEETRGDPTHSGDVRLPLARFVVSPGAHTTYLQLAAKLYEMNIPAGSMVSFDTLPALPSAAPPPSAPPKQSVPVRTARPRKRRIHL